MSRTFLVTTAVSVVSLIIALGAFFVFEFQRPATIGTQVATSSAASFAPAVPAADGGLVMYDPVVGNGLEVNDNHSLQLKLIYTGSYDDGEVFDSSYSKTPYIFSLGSADAPLGWNQGLLGMKVGGTRVLTIYPDFVGRGQYTSTLPADRTVIYTVRLLSIMEIDANEPFVPPPGTPQVQPGI